MGIRRLCDGGYIQDRDVIISDSVAYDPDWKQYYHSCITERGFGTWLYPEDKVCNNCGWKIEPNIRLLVKLVGREGNETR